MRVSWENNTENNTKTYIASTDGLRRQVVKHEKDGALRGGSGTTRWYGEWGGDTGIRLVKVKFVNGGSHAEREGLPRAPTPLCGNTSGETCP